MASRALAGGGTESQALDVKRVGRRVWAGDVVVLVGAVVVVLIGWGLKRVHDDRTVTVEAGGVRIAYPAGWNPLPVREPQLFLAASNRNGRERLIVSALDTHVADVRSAVASGAALPASGQSAFTPLRNAPSEVDGIASVRSDYAYVETTIGRASPPIVIRGRQQAWIEDGRIFVFALEAPEGSWDEVGEDFDRLVAKVAA